MKHFVVVNNILGKFPMESISWNYLKKRKPMRKVGILRRQSKAVDIVKLLMDMTLLECGIRLGLGIKYCEAVESTSIWGGGVIKSKRSGFQESSDICHSFCLLLQPGRPGCTVHISLYASRGDFDGRSSIKFYAEWIFKEVEMLFCIIKTRFWTYLHLFWYIFYNLRHVLSHWLDTSTVLSIKGNSIFWQNP